MIFDIYVHIIKANMIPPIRIDITVKYNNFLINGILITVFMYDILSIEIRSILQFWIIIFGVC